MSEHKLIASFFPEFDWSSPKLLEEVRRKAAETEEAVFIALFYIIEGSDFGYDACAEVKGLIESMDLNEIEKGYLYAMLLLEALKNGRDALAANTQKKLLLIERGVLPEDLLKYIESIKAPETKSVDLKGKERLVYEALLERPQNKIDLVTSLYGDDDYYKSENRFKALLSRLRKKIDQKIIINQEGLYELVP